MSFVGKICGSNSKHFLDGTSQLVKTEKRPLLSQPKNKTKTVLLAIFLAFDTVELRIYSLCYLLVFVVVRFSLHIFHWFQ